MGKIPGEADDSVENDEQTRLRGARRRTFRAAHRTIRLLIRPGDLRGLGSSTLGEEGREGWRRPRRDHHRDDWIVTTCT